MPYPIQPVTPLPAMDPDDGGHLVFHPKDDASVQRLTQWKMDFADELNLVTREDPTGNRREKMLAHARDLVNSEHQYAWQLGSMC